MLTSFSGNCCAAINSRTSSYSKVEFTAILDGVMVNLKLVLKSSPSSTGQSAGASINFPKGFPYLDYLLALQRKCVHTLNLNTTRYCLFVSNAEVL